MCISKNKFSCKQIKQVRNVFVSHVTVWRQAVQGSQCTTLSYCVATLCMAFTLWKLWSKRPLIWFKSNTPISHTYILSSRYKNILETVHTITFRASYFFIHTIIFRSYCQNLQCHMQLYKTLEEESTIPGSLVSS